MRFQALLLQQYGGPWSDVKDQEAPVAPLGVLSRRLCGTWALPGLQTVLMLPGLALGFHRRQEARRWFGAFLEEDGRKYVIPSFKK